MGFYIPHNAMMHRIINVEPAGLGPRGGIDEKNIRIRDGLAMRTTAVVNRYDASIFW